MAARCGGASGAERAPAPDACVVVPLLLASDSPVTIGVAHVPQAFAKSSLAEALKAGRSSGPQAANAAANSAYARCRRSSVRWSCAAKLKGHARPAVGVDDGLPAQVAAHILRHGRARKAAAGPVPPGRRGTDAERGTGFTTLANWTGWTRTLRAFSTKAFVQAAHTPHDFRRSSSMKSDFSMQCRPSSPRSCKRNFSSLTDRARSVASSSGAGAGAPEALRKNSVRSRM